MSLNTYLFFDGNCRGNSIKDKVAGQGLTLFCLPFDVVRPERSVHEIMQRLTGQ